MYAASQPRYWHERRGSVFPKGQPNNWQNTKLIYSSRLSELETGLAVLITTLLTVWQGRDRLGDEIVIWVIQMKMLMMNDYISKRHRNRAVRRGHSASKANKQSQRTNQISSPTTFSSDKSAGGPASLAYFPRKVLESFSTAQSAKGVKTVKRTATATAEQT